MRAILCTHTVFFTKWTVLLPLTLANKILQSLSHTYYIAENDTKLTSQLKINDTGGWWLDRKVRRGFDITCHYKQAKIFSQIWQNWSICILDKMTMVFLTSLAQTSWQLVHHHSLLSLILSLPMWHHKIWVHTHCRMGCFTRWDALILAVHHTLFFQNRAIVTLNKILIFFWC